MLAALASIGRDLVFGARALVRNPRTLLSAALILGLGSSVSIALFGVYDALVLNAFPFPDAGRLVSIECRTALAADVSHPLSAYAVRQVEGLTPVFESVASHSPLSSGLLVAEAGPQRVFVSPVSGAFFRTLGLRPSLGRWIDPSDGDRVLVLSHALWQRAFASDRHAVGRVVKLDGEAFRIVGVAPAAFRFPSEHTQAWIAAPFDARRLHDDFDQSQITFARLRPGATTKEADAALGVVSARLEMSQPEAYRGLSFQLSRLGDLVVGPSERLVHLLLGAVLCVLLVSCASATSILLARRTEQAANVRIRLGLGASGARLVREILCENLVVGLLGGLLGLAAALLSLRLVGRFGPASVSALGGTTLDWRIAGFALGVSTLAALLVTLVPARQVWRSQVLVAPGTLAAQAGWTTRRGSRAQLAICCVQVTAAVVLSLGAGLLLRSAWRLQSVDVGFDTGGLHAFFLDSAPPERGDDETTAASDLLAAIERVPGVSAAALVDAPVLRDVTLGTILRYETRDEGWRTSPLVHYRSVMGDYFRAMGIPIRRGRAFSREDDRNAPCVVIVNEWVASHFWPSADPLRQRLDLNPVETPHPYFCSVVGVTADVRDLRLDRPPGPTIYLAHAQRAGSPTTLLVRTVGGAPSPVRPVLDRLRSLIRNPQSVDVRSADDLVGAALREPRFRAMLLVLFAVVGMLLAVGGVYGVMVQVVEGRTREIGVRLALGAHPGQVRRHVMADAAIFTLVGLAAGVLGALGFGRLLSAFLYEVTPTDPWVYVSVPALVGIAALCASYWPTRRLEDADLASLLRAE